MAHFRVTQNRNGVGPVVQVGPTTRRYNGAVNVFDQHVLDCAAHLGSKANAGERVVTGPTTTDADGPVRVYLLGHDSTFWVEFRVERV